MPDQKRQSLGQRVDYVEDNSSFLQKAVDFSLPMHSFRFENKKYKRGKKLRG